MGEEAPAWIGATQQTLGSIVQKPKLTDNLLKKPPFRFLHDVVSATAKVSNAGTQEPRAKRRGLARFCRLFIACRYDHRGSRGTSGGRGWVAFCSRRLASPRAAECCYCHSCSAPPAPSAAFHALGIAAKGVIHPAAPRLQWFQESA